MATSGSLVSSARTNPAHKTTKNSEIGVANRCKFIVSRSFVDCGVRRHLMRQFVRVAETFHLLLQQRFKRFLPDFGFRRWHSLGALEEVVRRLGVPLVEIIERHAHVNHEVGAAW